MIPGSDDGKVSIDSAKVDGMQDFKVLHTTHPFIMRNKATLRNIVLFLQQGRFEVTEESPTQSHATRSRRTFHHPQRR